MYTILRLEYEEAITYLMILTDNLCSDYDYLTYDFSRKIFVNESFSKYSFIGKKNEITRMIEKIDEMITTNGLKSLMYDDIREHNGMNIEPIHIPEGFEFKNDPYFN